MKLVSRSLAIVVAGFAVSVLIGWLVGIPALTSFRFVYVRFDTAFGLLLGGITLWLTGEKSRSTGDWLGKGLSVILAALGTVVLAEYATGVDLGIDRLFISEGTNVPERMSAISALTFLLFGSAHFAAGRKGRGAALYFINAHTFGLLLNYLAIIGYMYDVTLLYGPYPALTMSYPAALSAFLLFMGLALTRPDLGWVKLLGAEAAGGTIARRFLPVLVLIVPTLGWLRLKGEQAGYYDTHAGLALFTITNIVLLAGIVLLVGRQANRIDAERAQSLTSLTARELQLRDSEERYRSVVDLLQDAIWIYRDGRVVYANPYAIDLLGAASTDQPTASRVHPDDRARTLADMQKALATSEPTPLASYRVTSLHGRELLLEARMSSFEGQGGRLLLVVARDVTAFRAAENQLREIQKLEAVGQLTGGIAHDFNNLLAVIKTNTEDLFDRLKDEPDYREQAGMVLQAADRGAALVKQLLAYSRKQLLTPEVIDLRGVIEPFAKLLRRTLPANIGIKISCTDTAAVYLDQGMLENAILNLAVNARDAMPEGGTLTIETAMTTLDDAYCRENPGIEPGPYVVICVSDTGAGIAPEILSRVFEPFFTTKEVGKGTGLGLSMVYGFVKQSGGHAKIYSEAGFGTTVKIYLPPRRLPEQAQAAPPAEATAPGTFSGSILLVEDDPLLQATVAAKLRRLGYEVTVAGTGMEAIDAVAGNPGFDLVFSDVVMPGPMTGADLAREIPKRWPEIKILLTSGYTAAASLGKIQIPPDIKLLSKPYSNADLSAAIREALET